MPRLEGVCGTPSLERTMTSPSPACPERPNNTSWVSYPAPEATIGNDNAVVGAAADSFNIGVDVIMNLPSVLYMQRSVTSPSGSDEVTRSRPWNPSLRPGNKSVRYCARVPFGGNVTEVQPTWVPSRPLNSRNTV